MVPNLGKINFGRKYIEEVESVASSEKGMDLETIMIGTISIL